MLLRFSPILACLVLTCGVAAASTDATPPGAAAGNPPADGADPPPGWSGRVVAGAAAVPDFQGSRSSRSGALVGLDAAYTTAAAGTWHLGTAGLGWSHRLGDVRFGIGLGGDRGRRDDGGHGGRPEAKPGHARLAGLGDIDGTPVVTLFAGTRLGAVPVQLSLAKATRSHRGTQLNLALPLRFTLNDALTLGVTPALTWADSRYTQAFFGVSPEQAARTSYRAFDASAGLKSASLDLAVDYKLGGGWGLHAGASFSRLLGDAARSPVTERRRQIRSMLALLYQF